MMIAVELDNIRQTTRHLKEQLQVAKDAIRSAALSVERIEEQLRIIETTRQQDLLKRSIKRNKEVR